MRKLEIIDAQISKEIEYLVCQCVIERKWDFSTGLFPSHGEE